ncbi:MAG TPA: hypothetical protein DCW37_01435 [Cellvibrionales bacterium]|jgi:hypothetical protein|nr:hypothetical protein [Cellvibrionales bacterium]
MKGQLNDFIGYLMINPQLPLLSNWRKNRGKRTIPRLFERVRQGAWIKIIKAIITASANRVHLPAI